MALASVAVATAAISALKDVAPDVSVSLVYLPAVLLVAACWGLPLGLATSLLSAAAFNFFHLPPLGRFTIADATTATSQRRYIRTDPGVGYRFAD